MRPSDANLSMVRELLTSIGFRGDESKQDLVEFNDPEVPAMSDVVTLFKKGRRRVRLQEIFVRNEGRDERVAIILAVASGGRWTEIYEMDEILEHFRSDIRDMRISKVIR